MGFLHPIATIATASAMLVNVLGFSLTPTSHMLAQHEISLEDRYPVTSVNEVFKDNILLTMMYLKGKTPKPDSINWSEVEKPFQYEFTLKPQETFAFHEDVLPEYKGKVAKTTNAHFIGEEGFKTDGYLFGDGVCHLASLFYWTAKDAGLSVKAPTNHDFHEIPDIPKEYGVSIYSLPGQASSNELQNLYVTNTLEKPITFRFAYNDGKLKASIFTLD